MHEGLAVVKNLIFEANSDIEKLKKFYKYLEKTWYPLRKIVSVYDRPLATNNICEQFNREAQRILGKHTELWIMLGNDAGKIIINETK